MAFAKCQTMILESYWRVNQIRQTRSGGYIGDLGKKPALQGNSLAVQWSGCHAFTAEGAGSIPGRGIKIPQAVRHGKPTNQQTNLLYREQERNCMKIQGPTT